MGDWQANLVRDPEGIASIVRAARRIAVLGIKPESRSDQPAWYVPEYLHSAGLTIIPVPVYYPELTEILGEKVYRKLADIPGELDLVDVFRRPGDIPPHLPDLLAKRPKAVWFQSGIVNDEAAETLAKAGIPVVQNRCLMVEHRKLR